MEPDDIVEFTEHAKEAIKERKIEYHWIQQTLNEPELRTQDPNDSQVERFFQKIPENGNRVLRVAVNTNAWPWKVVSVFFDRTMKGKL
jgi:hypothetical protein